MGEGWWRSVYWFELLLPSGK